MPRSPRIDVPGLVYHITNRGTNKQDIFLSDRDRQDFLRLLLMAYAEFPFILHAYCLMTNHFHLLLETIDHSLSRTMQYLTGMYGQLFNRRHQRIGRVLQGRFHSIPVQQDAYFTVAARYIHLNPVRAGIVQRPEDYAWSNYGNLIKGKPDRFVNPAQLLGYFGADSMKQRLLYQSFVNSMIDKPEPITRRALQRMRAWGDLRIIERQQTAMAQIPQKTTPFGSNPNGVF